MKLRKIVNIDDKIEWCKRSELMNRNNLLSIALAT